MPDPRKYTSIFHLRVPLANHWALIVYGLGSLHQNPARWWPLVKMPPSGFGICANSQNAGLPRVDAHARIWWNATVAPSCGVILYIVTYTYIYIYIYGSVRLSRPRLRSENKNGGNGAPWANGTHCLFLLVWVWRPPTSWGLRPPRTPQWRP